MPAVKPNVASWRPAASPPGVAGYWPIMDRSATVIRAANNPASSMAATGAPTLGSGRYGPQLSGFSTANYYETPQAPFPLYGSVYPYWLACMFFTTDATTNQVLVACSSSSAIQPALWLQSNFTAAGAVGAFLRNDAGTAVNVTGGANVNDGNVKVAQVVVYATNSARVFLNGISVASSGTTIATINCTHVNLGAARRSSGVTSGAVGSTIIAAACGFGKVPDAMALYRDWITGSFSAIRPSLESAILIPMSGSPAAGGEERYRFFSPGGSLFGLRGA